ncbi:MAG: DUF3341 domain-containing protein [Terriglobia bacterium]
MSEKTTAIFGIYLAAADVELGVEALRAGGFRNEDISVLFAEASGLKHVADEHGNASGAAEAALVGAGAGGLIGGALGVLAGIGVLTIPGAGPFIAGGPMMAGLAGLSVGGALGGITGALVGMGVPEYEAKGYDGRIQEGAILLSVHAAAPDRIERAQEALRRTGAQDISFTVAMGSDLAANEQPFPRPVPARESI